MIEQAIILIGSALAIHWFASPAPYRFWGFVVSLAIQPVWLYATFMSGQWGMFLLTFYYIYASLRGIRTNWHEKSLDRNMDDVETDRYSG